MKDIPIKEFVYEDYGYFIDTEYKGNVSGSFSVGLDGEITMGSYGFVISKDAFNKFELAKDCGDKYAMSINFGNNKNFSLGFTEDRDSAEKWIEIVSRAIKGD